MVVQGMRPGETEGRTEDAEVTADPREGSRSAIQSGSKDSSEGQGIAVAQKPEAKDVLNRKGQSKLRVSKRTNRMQNTNAYERRRQEAKRSKQQSGICRSRRIGPKHTHKD